MNLYRRNLLRGLYPANSKLDVAPLELEISDQEAFGVSKFCRCVGTELDIEPLMPADAVLLLQLEAEPRIASIRAIDGDMHISHLLVSAAANGFIPFFSAVAVCFYYPVIMLPTAVLRLFTRFF